MRKIATKTVFTSVTLAFALMGFSATDTSAQTTCTANAGPFSIDGRVGDTGTDPCNNSGLAPGALKTVDIAGNNKELSPENGTDTKINVIHLATPPMLALESNNAQTDLNTVYTQSALATDLSLWFYFGWIRDSSNGSGFISIEFDHAAPPTACAYNTTPTPQLIQNCNPWANRADGDFIILWDQSGNSTLISVRTFENGSFGPPVALSAAQAVAAYGAPNNTDTSRGEVGLNISAIVGGSPTQCLTFANIIPGTVTGNSDQADYKDTVLSQFPVASNCGTVTIQKVTNPAGQDGIFGYELTAVTTPIFDVNVDTDCSVSGQSNKNVCQGTLTGLLAGNNTDSITDLLARNNYTLTEPTIASGFQKVSIFCTPEGGTAIDITNGGTFPVVGAKTTACVITNEFQTTTPGFNSVQTLKAFDSATLTGVRLGASNAGNARVTFTLYSDTTCTTLVSGGTVGPLPLTYSGTTGTGTATANTLSSVGINVSSNGTYSWALAYTGDALNNPLTVADTCGFEKVQVTFTPGQ
jgi:hypothetical protein